MKASDELREWASHAMVNKHADVRELAAIADRIDREMLELPRDKDGVPIHVGDTVYTAGGSMGNVARICLMQNTVHVKCGFSDGTIIEFCPADITHTRPDSLERIADELEEWSEYNRVNGSREVFDRASIFADRIRRLAKKEDER